MKYYKEITKRMFHHTPSEYSLEETIIYYRCENDNWEEYDDVLKEWCDITSPGKGFHVEEITEDEMFLEMV